MTPSAPDHQGGGDQLRQAHLLDEVATAFDVHLLTPQEATDPRVTAALVEQTIVSAAPRPPAGRLERLVHLLAHDPFVARRAAPLRRAMRRELPGLVPQVDAVVVEHLELARLHDPNVRVPWLLTIHLAHSRHFRQVANTMRGRQRWFWRLDAARAARLERWAARTYDRVVTVSEEDAAVIPGGAIVVPNGADLIHEPTPLPAAPRVVVTGSYDFAPNVDGVLWFLDQCWPRIHTQVPDASLAIVGRRPPPSLVDAAGNAAGVTLHADVPEIAPHLETARVALVPIRVGAGTRLKALQGLAAGRVVVGTPVGLEGLGLVHGRHALVAEDADDLAAAVVVACTDDALATRMAAAGRAYAEAWSWPTVAQPLVTTLQALVRPGPAA